MWPSDLPVPLGSLLQGKYRLVEVLGGGGMGVVVTAHHEQLDRRVALKFLRPEAIHNPEAAARFGREARAASRIQSEHVVRVLDFGETENGAPFIVMEYLEGEDLSEVLERSGPLSVEVAVDYVLQACEAIAEAHAVGIVHRDLKPANLFLSHRADGSCLVKVCDFGIAKAVVGELTKLTQANAFVGSPVYSAPEQARAAEAVDARADIWALGVILFELLTGKVPFEGRTVPEIVTRILSEPPPDVRSLRPELPATLAATINACLQRDVEKRLLNVAILAAELKECAPASSRISVDRIARVLGDRSLPPGSNQPATPPVLRSDSGSQSSPRNGSTLRNVSPSLPSSAPNAVGLETHQPQSLSIASTAKPRNNLLRWALLALGVLGLTVAVLVVRAQNTSQPPLAGESGVGGAVARSSGAATSVEVLPSALTSGSAPPLPSVSVHAEPTSPSVPSSSAKDAAPVKSNARTPVSRAAPPSTHVAPPRPRPNAADEEPNVLDMNLK